MNHLQAKAAGKTEPQSLRLSIRAYKIFYGGDTQLKAICPHWRDPGATSTVDEPINLIAQVLDHGAYGIQSLFDELSGVLAIGLAALAFGFSRKR